MLLVAVVVLFGGSRVSAWTSSERGADHRLAGTDVDGTMPLFDDGVVHEISVEIDADEYDALIESFKDEGSKVMIEATVTIDGTRIDRAGIRLKGNSTLFGLGGRGPGGFGPRPLAGRPAGDLGEPPGGGIPGGGFPGGGPFAGGPGQGAAADEPELLPWLIRFDAFVDGQTYEGYESIAVRPSTRSQTPETALNEALALRLIARAGEPSQKSTYASFTFNDSKRTLRHVVEEPGKRFAEDVFTRDGVLYKALSTGRFEYRGDDPLSYRDSFRQITRRKQQDLQPVLELLRWVGRATDDELAAGLDEHVDVESLARYAALHHLVLDWDDMAGPGQNYYLWYDLEDRRFRVVSWDLNLAFSRDDGQGIFDQGGFRFGGRGGNPLKERFLSIPAFRDLYRGTYADLHDRLLASGAALDELARLERVIASGNAVDAETLGAEAAALRALIEQRTVELAGELRRSG